MLPCGRKNPLPFPYFRSGHMSAICARLSKGKGRFTRGWKPQVSTLLCARAASAQLPAEVQRITPRPSGANTLAQCVYPAKSVQKRLPPRQSVSLTRLVCSGHPVQKRRRPDRVNRLRGSSAPVNQRKIMDSCRCSTNTTCRSTTNLLQ